MGDDTCQSPGRSRSLLTIESHLLHVVGPWDKKQLSRQTSCSAPCACCPCALITSGIAIVKRAENTATSEAWQQSENENARGSVAIGARNLPPFCSCAGRMGTILNCATSEGPGTHCWFDLNITLYRVSRHRSKLAWTFASHILWLSDWNSAIPTSDILVMTTFVAA